MLWLVSVRDVFSNMVVGWRTEPRADTDLVFSALDYAVFARDVRGGELIFHSHNGCQHTALRFAHRLMDAGMAPRTGSVGDSFDSALAEDLWSTLLVRCAAFSPVFMAFSRRVRTRLARPIRSSGGRNHPSRAHRSEKGKVPGDPGIHARP
ncbi:DDE-type integrase/transposase/recombinase [Rhodococcus opacus]|uniref:DDE-type integrase/transposase/recombinase n=1 Tax=Rhodococcus opacus TaxID=37919 RepID=UPI003899B0D8